MTTVKSLNPRILRKQFPMLARAGRHCAYLDSAASSQTPETVIRAMDAYYREFRANVHRGMYPASERATAAYEHARERVAEFLNADPKGIIFTRGATEALNLAAALAAQQLKPGDEVVTTVLEHHSNMVPWQQFAKRLGLKLKYVGLTPEQALDFNAAAQLITAKTKVVAAMHVSNALGTVLPIRRLSELAHRRGATFIVDAAQSAGHRPVDVQELGCDYLAVAGHKMFGPTGVGVLYGRPELLQAAEPISFGGDMISEVSFEGATWNELPWKFEAGTPNVAGVIGLGAAVDFIGRLGLKNIQAHEAKLAAYAQKRLLAIPKVRVYGPPPGVERAGVVSFRIGDIHPHDLTTVLAGQGICVRGGHHCAMPLMRYLKISGTTRASLSIYNDERDIDALVAAVERAARLFRL